MNMTQKIQYQIEFSKDEMTLVTKALTGVLKERDLEKAKELGIKCLEEMKILSQERLQINSGALERAYTLTNSTLLQR